MENVSYKMEETAGILVNLHQVWEDNRILERARHPYQIQRILIHADLAGQT